MADVSIRWRAVAIGECDWLTISPSSGTGSADITFSASTAQWYTKKEDAKCDVKIYDIDNETSSATTCFERCIECFSCNKLLTANTITLDYNETQETTLFTLERSYLPESFTITATSDKPWLSASTSGVNIIGTAELYKSTESDREANLTIEVKLNDFPEGSFVCNATVKQTKDPNNCGCDNLEFEELGTCSCADIAFNSVQTIEVCKCHYRIDFSGEQLTCSGGTVTFNTPELERVNCGNNEEIIIGSYTSDECVTSITNASFSSVSWLSDIRLDTTNKNVKAKIKSDALSSLGTVENEATVTASLTINGNISCEKSFTVKTKCVQD